MASSNTKKFCRMIQNFQLVWLNGNLDHVNNDDFNKSISKFQEVVNTVNTFDDVDKCIDFITDTKYEHTLLILSGQLPDIVFSLGHDLSQVTSIYMFDNNTTSCEESTKKWSKLKGSFTSIQSLCEQMKSDAKICDHNTMSISLIKKSDVTSKHNLDTLDSSFMYTQILKEILLTINFKSKHFHEFITYCRKQVIDNNNISIKHVDMIAKEYVEHKPIWWYTYDCFLYSMLNRALRRMEVDTIIKMGFFLKDLHNHITQLHQQQFHKQNHPPLLLTVYRGQGLSKIDFAKLQETQGGLLSFNNFLSTSCDREVSYAFAESILSSADLIGIVFEITIHSSIVSSPFANIQNVSYFKGEEEEILFSMHSVFRIGEIQQTGGNGRLCQVNLRLTSDNDAELHALTEHIREETFPHAKGWYRLGELLLKLGEYDKAQQVCDSLLEETSDEVEKMRIYHMLGIVNNRKGKYEDAIEYCEKSNRTLQKILSPTHRDSAFSYNNIAMVYQNMGEYSKALSYNAKAVEIIQKALPPNHPDLATYYSNIGMVYKDMGGYSKALSYFEKALEIFRKTLPANHPNLAVSYNNIGLVYYNMGECSKALSYHDQALEIFQKILPANHPDLANSYNNIGMVYYNMREYSKAISYQEKALEIFQKTLPANHPALARSYNNIAGVYCDMRQYSKALLYFEKGLEMFQKTLPANHPCLAASYNNIAGVYDSMGEYSKALSYYDEALEIFRKTLPANHPDLATSYNNIGMVYKDMGEYSKALSYQEKALEIFQKTLPANHPCLAASYNNIGMVYKDMGEYSKALSYQEKALKIRQKIFSSKSS